MNASTAAVINILTKSTTNAQLNFMDIKQTEITLFMQSLMIVRIQEQISKCF